MGNKNIKSISFWRRNPQSVEEIQSIKIEKNKNGVCLNDNIKLDENVLSDLVDTLLNKLNLEDTKEPYRAFLYEDDQNNYQIKFFLIVSFADSTYLAIKGIHPFQQKNYKEIQEVFNKLF